MFRIPTLVLVVALCACSQVSNSYEVRESASANNSADIDGAASPVAPASEIAPEEPTSLLFATQDERDVGFRSIKQILPTRKISSGDNVYPMPSAPVDVELSYTLDEQAHSFSDFLQNRELRGLLVWRDGEIVFEHYHPETHSRDALGFVLSIQVSDLDANWRSD